MARSKIVLTPSIVGEELVLTDEERWLLPQNVVRQYRAYEAIQLQKFNGKWKLDRLPIDENYHTKVKPWIDKDPGTSNREAELDKLEKEYNSQIANHTNKKNADWGPVLKDLQRHKKFLLAQCLASLNTQQAIESDYRIPQQGRWITFPLWNLEETSDRYSVNVDKYNGKPVTITWKSANTTFNATYYKTTCWFGELMYDQVLAEDPGPSITYAESKPAAPGTEQQAAPDASASQAGQVSEPAQKTSTTRTKLDAAKKFADEVDQENKPAGASAVSPPAITGEVASVPGSGKRWKASMRLKPFGETELFIAAEFIEQRYQGAPHLQGFHLRDNSPTGTKWAYLRLDASMHYGQNFDPPQYRYLVYHPFIRDRNIPQRAFADNVMLDTADTLATSAASSSNDYIATAGSAAGGLLKIVRTLGAHPLRRFEPLDGDQRLYNVPEEMTKWEAKWNAGARSIPAHLEAFDTAAQIAATDQKLEQVLVESSRVDRPEDAAETREQVAVIVQEQAAAQEEARQPDSVREPRYLRPFIIKRGSKWHDKTAESIEKQLVPELKQRDHQQDTHSRGDADYKGQPGRMLDAGSKDVRQRITKGTVSKHPG